MTTVLFDCAFVCLGCWVAIAKSFCTTSAMAYCRWFEKYVTIMHTLLNLLQHLEKTRIRKQPIRIRWERPKFLVMDLLSYLIVELSSLSRQKTDLLHISYDCASIIDGRSSTRPRAGLRIIIACSFCGPTVAKKVCMWTVFCGNRAIEDRNVLFPNMAEVCWKDY